ncbi:MAG: discoidin domain-containing protein [Clostridiales bacterium]|jgi:hypothetical protein|nr:discoidin domain-containing protein [Clostridiales bacterium]
MKKGLTVVCLILALALIFAGCGTRRVEREREIEVEKERDVEVEKEREVPFTYTEYDISGAEYDVKDTRFDYTDSANRIVAAQGHSQGTPITGADTGGNTLKNLRDGNPRTAYFSALDTGRDHEVSFTVDLERYAFVDRIELTPATGQDERTVGFPRDFYVEFSLNGGDWTLVVLKKGYPVPEGSKSFRIGAQSARYIRFTATGLRADGNGEYRLGLADFGAWFDRYSNNGYAAAEPNAAYYVSASAGNDSFDGLSEHTPFQSLNRLNRFIFGPGNQILFKRGDVWRGQTFMPAGDGSEADPIRIAAYGEGGAPVIAAGMGAAFGIRIYNRNYYSIQDLAFEKSVAGIKIESDLRNFDEADGSFDAGRGYEIKNCSFTDIRGNAIESGLLKSPYPDMYFGAGIHFTATGMPSTWGYKDPAVQRGGRPYVFPGDRPAVYMRDIDIEDCGFLRCDTGIFNSLLDLYSGRAYNGTGAGVYIYNSDCDPNGGHLQTFSNHSVQNMTVRNVNVRQSYKSGGIMVYGVRNGLFDNIKIDETGTVGMYWGVAAFQISLSSECVIQNCEFSRTYLRNVSVDGEGFDFESGNENITLKDTYIHDNDGPSVLFYGGNNGWGGLNKNCVIDNCRLENNGSFNNKGLAQYDHSKVFKDYPDLKQEVGGDGVTYRMGNEGGIVKNTSITLRFEGQCYSSGYVLQGDSSKGVYDAVSDTTQVGLKFDASNRVYNPNGRQIAGAEGPGLAALGVVSQGAAFKIGRVNASGIFAEDTELAYDGQFDGDHAFSFARLFDGEFSGAEPYNTGFASKRFPAADMGGDNLTIQIDLGAAAEVNGVRLFGVQTHPRWGVGACGALLPKAFKIYVSDDGAEWAAARIAAVTAEGAPTSVTEVVGYRPDAARPANDFVFSDAELFGMTARYVRLVVTEINADPINGNYMLQIAELQVIGGYNFDFRSTYKTA